MDKLLLEMAQAFYLSKQSSVDPTNKSNLMMLEILVQIQYLTTINQRIFQRSVKSQFQGLFLQRQL